MPQNESNLRYHVRSTIVAAVVGFATVVVFCDSCWDNPILYLRVGPYMSLIWIVMWKGNEAASVYFDKMARWLEEPGKRLAIGIVGHFVYTVAAMIILSYLVYILFGWNRDIITLEGMVRYSVPAVAITFAISMFSTAKMFFLSWRQLAINQEKMKAEVISSKFESLKNQVNPHFLFNSLNVLTSLVYKDADLSAEFIRKLSDVYRYVLDVQSKEIVDLDEELSFLHAFSYLLKMRHAEGLKINIDVAEKTNLNIPPLALQMLVENAVKHNIISKMEPLTINVNAEDGYLVVQNNLQRKEAKTPRSSSLGLSNIKARYDFLSDKPVIIEESESAFTVKIPVLELAG